MRYAWLPVIALVAVMWFAPRGGGLASLTNSIAPIDATDVIASTNAVRTSIGLKPLTSNATLAAAAHAKLVDMEGRGYFAHVAPDGTQPWSFIVQAGYPYQRAGENLARGFGDADVLVKAWMGSPLHRANIINSGYRDIGVATGRITLNGRPSTVVVQMFGAPRVAKQKTSALPARISALLDLIF